MLCVINIFPFCNYGTWSVESLQSIGDVAYASMWYKLAFHKDQKYIRMIIEFAHIPRKVTGYGLIRCSLETYINVRSYEKINEIYANRLKTNIIFSC